MSACAIPDAVSTCPLQGSSLGVLVSIRVSGFCNSSSSDTNSNISSSNINNSNSNRNQICRPTYLPSYVPDLPTYLPTYLPTSQLSDLPTYQPANLPSCQPAYLFASCKGGGVVLTYGKHQTSIPTRLETGRRFF